MSVEGKPARNTSKAVERGILWIEWKTGAMILPALIGGVRSQDFSEKGFRSKAFPASLAGFPFIYDLFFKRLNYYEIICFDRGLR
jgi:hypothetical protein